MQFVQEATTSSELLEWERYLEEQLENNPTYLYLAMILQELKCHRLRTSLDKIPLDHLILKNRRDTEETIEDNRQVEDLTPEEYETEKTKAGEKARGLFGALLSINPT